MSRQDDEMVWLEQAEGVPRSTYNQMWYEWLGGQGYTGTLDERWYKYAGDRGLAGALPDRLTKLFCNNLFLATTVSWVLASGVWDDNGVWIDSETWSDA